MFCLVFKIIVLIFAERKIITAYNYNMKHLNQHSNIHCPLTWNVLPSYKECSRFYFSSQKLTRKQEVNLLWLFYKQIVKSISIPRCFFCVSNFDILILIKRKGKPIGGGYSFEMSLRIQWRQIKTIITELKLFGVNDSYGFDSHPFHK